MAGLSIKTTSSIHDIPAETWNQLSGGRPFQSHHWYAYGERVMADCPPVYLLGYDGDELVARAALWLVRNEPVPKMLGPFKKVAQTFVRRWPPFICRSPLAQAPGFVLPFGPDRRRILAALAQASVTEAVARGALFTVFDYLNQIDARDWPFNFSLLKFTDSGTLMKNHWNSLDEYLAASVNKKNRRHHKHIMQETRRLGVQLNRYKQVPNVDLALDLIRNVERRHDALPNPWMRAMLENMEMVDGTWLEARIGEQLVGCMLLLEDNGAQTATALGLADGISDIYFLLLFAGLEVAMENKVSLLRWGSGAYEAKRRLGFELEHNNFVSIGGTNWATQRIAHTFANSPAS